VWEKVKAFCLYSATIAWSYFLAFVGFAMQFVDASADIFNDPSFKDTVHGLVGDSRTFGQILLGISIINIIARLRTLRKQV
jgi:hypothetical protein